MKKSKATIIIVSILVLAMTFGATFGANAAGIVSVNVDGTYGQTEARSMLASVNSFRASSDAWYWNEDDSSKTVCSNLKPLVYDYKLEKIAMQRAAEIAVNFSHTRPDGTKWNTAFSDEGLSATAGAENIAGYQKTADAAYTSWREDDNPYSGQGHRRNMLTDKYTAIGIAKFTYNGQNYWVQEFYKESVDTTETAANDSAASVPMNVDSAKLADYGIDNLTTGPAITHATTAPATTAPTTKPATTKPATTSSKPAATKIKSLTAAKKQFKVKWNKVSGVKGYDVQYSTSAKFKGAKTKTIAKANVTALTVKSLKSKKKYYVRVRTYKVVKGKKVCSKWTAAKSVKVK